MEFPCPHCGLSLESEDEMQGRGVSCPRCGRPFHVPLSPHHPLREKQDEWDRLLKSAGMSPASMFDYREAVTWVVVHEVLQSDVAKECERYAPDERSTFMMAYTALMKWGAMRRVETTFPQGWWLGIVPLLEREFSKQPWYRAETVDRIAELIGKTPTTRGRVFGVASGPWQDAITAANRSGFKLSHSANLEFILTVSLSVKGLLETIGKWGAKAHLLED
jgi:hypothetical protein